MPEKVYTKKKKKVFQYLSITRAHKSDKNKY